MTTKTEDQGKYSEEDEILFEGGNGDTCCGFIPLKLGIQIISVLSIIQIIYGHIFTFKYLRGNLGVGVALIALVSNLMASLLFGKWLSDDNKANREYLIKAAMLVMLSIICNVIWFLLVVFFFNDLQYTFA